MMNDFQDKKLILFTNKALPNTIKMSTLQIFFF